MAAQKIIHMGHPTLRQVAEKISLDEIQTPAFKELLQDMYDTMKAEGGIGIAAPQINISKQVALIEIPAQSKRYDDLQTTPLMIIINPVISILDHQLQGFWEGCLSVPGLRGYVERPQKVQIDFLNEKGEKQQIVAENFQATVFQHEIDHLFGKIYIDRITDTTKFSYQKEFDQFISSQVGKTHPEDNFDE